MGVGKVVATICARGGSKGVPGKNLREVGGRSLIARAIECAQAARGVDEIVVSTDDDDIARVAEACGLPVPFRRPRELAVDSAAKLPAIRHAVQWLETNRGLAFDLVLDLDVTVGLRAPEDVDACARALRERSLDAVITVYEPDRNPYFNMVELDDGLAQPVKRPPRPIYCRQDAPRVFGISGAVIGFRREFLEQTDYIFDGRVGVVELPPERAIDIDREIDFKLTELLVSETDAEAR